MQIRIQRRDALCNYQVHEIIVDAMVGMRLNALGGSTQRTVSNGDYLVSATEVLTALACSSRPAYEFALETALFTNGGYIILNRQACQMGW